MTEKDITKKCGALSPVIYSLIIAVIVGFDQSVKYAATYYLKGMPGKEIISNIFTLDYVENPGAAFSMFIGEKLILIVFPAVAVFVMLYYIFLKPHGTVMGLGFAFIVSGGIGNLIDRLRMGYVIDCFNLHGFAVFNCADIFVCLGCGLVVIELFFFEGRRG